MSEIEIPLTVVKLSQGAQPDAVNVTVAFSSQYKRLVKDNFGLAYNVVCDLKQLLALMPICTECEEARASGEYVLDKSELQP